MRRGRVGGQVSRHLERNHYPFALGEDLAQTAKKTVTDEHINLWQNLGGGPPYKKHGVKKSILERLGVTRNRRCPACLTSPVGFKREGTRSISVQHKKKVPERYRT